MVQHGLFYSDDVNHPEYNAAVIDLIDYIDANAGVSEGRFNFSVSDWSAFELTTSQINQIVSDATTIMGHTLSNLVERALSIEGNSVVALNRVAISAPYLNINGDIQSGNPDRSVLINLDQSYIDGLEAQYLSDPEQGSLIEISEDVIGNIAVYYNAELDRLEVAPVRMEGGRIDLFGDILSTGNGNIRVFDGYGNINVTNNTTLPLVINRLDAGQGIEGTVRIVDQSKDSGVPGQPLVTEYVRVNGQIEIQIRPAIARRSHSECSPHHCRSVPHGQLHTAKWFGLSV